VSSGSDLLEVVYLTELPYLLLQLLLLQCCSCLCVCCSNDIGRSSNQPVTCVPSHS